MITEHDLIEAIAEALRSGFTGVKMTRVAIEAAQTIADNAAAAAMVTGGRVVRPMDVDLRWCAATLSKNGVIEESGVSAAIMGHPGLNSGHSHERE